jgi:endogenous inhibitor of DNA gyrase (YacG/DUF329 family)
MTVKCPTCKASVDWDSNKARPFCSDRCRLIDLGKWFDEEYSIEAEPDEFDEFDIPPY